MWPSRMGWIWKCVCFELSPSRLWHFFIADSFSLCLLSLGAVASFHYFWQSFEVSDTILSLASFFFSSQRLTIFCVQGKKMIYRSLEITDCNRKRKNTLSCICFFYVAWKPWKHGFTWQWQMTSKTRAGTNYLIGTMDLRQCLAFTFV